jgi:hypothetical protein
MTGGTEMSEIKTIYAIHVKGRLDEQWSSWFDDMLFLVHTHVESGPSFDVEPPSYL